MIFCWLEGIDAADKSFALILLVVTAPLTGTGAGGLGGEDSWVSGVMEDKSFASMEELELGSGLKLINISNRDERKAECVSLVLLVLKVPGLDLVLPPDQVLLVSCHPAV